MCCVVYNVRCCFLHLLNCCSSDVLRKVIAQQVAAMMVLPNKLPIVLSNDIARQVVKLPEPEVGVRLYSFYCTF